MLSFDDLDLLEVKVNGLNCLRNILYTLYFARQGIQKSYNIFSVSPRLQYVFGDIAFCKFSDLWPIWPGDADKSGRKPNLAQSIIYLVWKYEDILTSSFWDIGPDSKGTVEGCRGQGH